MTERPWTAQEWNEWGEAWWNRWHELVRKGGTDAEIQEAKRACREAAREGRRAARVEAPRARADSGET